MIKLAAWTSVAAIAAAFGFGGVSAEAHSPAGYCAGHSEHEHCALAGEPPDFPNIGDFLGPFVALGTCIDGFCIDGANVGDACFDDTECPGEEVNGKGAINSYGLYLVETTGLEPMTPYDVCLAGLILETNDDLTTFTKSVNDNAGTDGSGNLRTDGRLTWLAGKTIIQPSFQIIFGLGFHCDTNPGPIVQETGLTGIQ